jgi:hypothetical protein
LACWKLLSEKFPIIRNIQQGIIINVHRPSFKVPFTYVFLPTDFQKNPQTSNFIKILPVGTESFHVDGQTDRQTNRQTDRLAKIIVTFRNCAKRLNSHIGNLFYGRDLKAALPKYQCTVLPLHHTARLM